MNTCLVGLEVSLFPFPDLQCDKPENCSLGDFRYCRSSAELCVKSSAKLLVLDTLSSLFRGMREDKADDWDLVLPWLLDLRRRRIAVLIVAHAGWNHEHMRGTSRREDDAFWVVSVKELADRAPAERGAKFETEFTKVRNVDCRPLTRHWSFNTEDSGTISWRCDQLSFDEKVFDLIQAGISSATEIAEQLKSTKGTVSKAVVRPESAKLITRRGSGNRTTYEPYGLLRDER